MNLLTRRTRLVAVGALMAAAVSACAVNGAEDTSDGADALTSQDAVAGKPRLNLTDDQRRDMVSKKTTCPFVGTALAMKKIFAYGTLADPVALIAGLPGTAALSAAQEGSAVKAGGAGDLPQGFRIVARGNHNTGGDGVRAPEGMFSLDFPNSQGAHAAHSFILMGNPRALDSGRLTEQNLGRLINEKSKGGHAELVNGKLVVRRSELGNFVARNVACDPHAVSISRGPFGFVSLLGGDIVEFTERAATLTLSKLSGSMSEPEKTQLLEGMLQIATRNNLVGSAAEFGLLTSALEGSTNAVTLSNGERALSVDDIEGIFAGKKVDGKYDPLTRRLPPNWETTPKTTVRFLINTVEILKVAGLQNLANTYEADNTCFDTR